MRYKEGKYNRMFVSNLYSEDDWVIDRNGNLVLREDYEIPAESAVQ